jgi:hypothetical protein
MNLPNLVIVGAQIASALSIGKSSNKNQVHYAVDVDEGCTPVGAAPVHPYWRMLEKSPDATEGLSGTEQRAYGVARQEIDHDTVRIVLKSLPQRPIVIRTWRANNGMCASEASTTISGTPARLDGIFVKLKLFGVDYVQLSGVAPTGAAVQEKLSV